MATERLDPPRIPNAEFRKHLGSGGFAEVFLYTQVMPRRDVAVKVLKRGTTAEQTASFEAEANLMAQVSHHPSIVSVYTANVTEDGRSYLVMEYCPPPNLGRRAKERPYTVPQVLNIGIRIAGAVETLHRRGILHRDIKPANILLTQFDHPVLIDFGIAVSTENNCESGVGFSIPWAPPEQQTDSGPFGPSLDVYSLAATLHTILTGRSPFEIPGGDNSELAMLNRVHNQPVPSTGRADVPQELERILAIAMSKDPARRYRSIYEFAQALQQVQVSLRQTPTPIEVEDTTATARVDHSDDDDRTAAAPIVVIDPHTASAPSRTPTPPATSSATSPWSAPSDSAVPTSRPLRPPAGSPFASRGPSAGAYQADQTATNGTWVDEDTRIDPSAHSQHNGATQSLVSAHPELATPAVQTPVSETESEQSLESTKRRPGRIIALILAVILLGGAAIFGVWTFLRGEGATQTPTQDTPQHNSPEALPITPSDTGINGLMGQVSDNGVTFSWDAYDETSTYLYRVIDPMGEERVRETRQTTVTVEPVPGRTCLEVVVRRSDGSTTEAIIECVENP